MRTSYTFLMQNIVEEFKGNVYFNILYHNGYFPHRAVKCEAWFKAQSYRHNLVRNL